MHDTLNDKVTVLMANDDFEDFHRPLVHAVQSVDLSMNTLALLGLAKEFYSKEERSALYLEYDKLVKADSDARDAYHAAGPNDGLGVSDRVKILGAKAANEALNTSRDLRQKLDQEYRKLTQFEKNHPIILALIKIKDGKAKK